MAITGISGVYVVETPIVSTVSTLYKSSHITIILLSTFIIGGATREVHARLPYYRMCFPFRCARVADASRHQR
jgi:hypothetical protein